MASIGFALALLVASRAAAHPPVATAALVNINDAGEVVIHVVHDALAFALNDTSQRIGDREMYALLDGPEDELATAFADGRERFLTGFNMTADGRDVAFRLEQAPDLAAIRQWNSEHSGRTLPCKLEFVVKAQLPADAQAITLQFPDILADTLIIVTRPGREPLTIPLLAGEQSPELEVNIARAINSTRSATRPDTGDSIAPPHRTVESISALAVAWRFVRLGFTHIIPDGPDHCLFVLGLFLLSPHIRQVLWQISAFTIAHTITLTLTSLHVIGLPSSVVEPTIALSIAFIGIENLCTTEVHRWRVAIAFIFGLVHGMGVATAFHEAGFPPGQLVSSLASFTIGVEAGHIAMLALAFIALGWTRDKPWYRQRVAVPLSLAITAIALFWLVQRVTSL